MQIFDKLIDYFHLYRQEAWATVEDLWQLWPVRIYVAAFILTNLAAWYGAGHIYRNIGQPELALHYSVDFGIDIYGPVARLFVLPALGLVFYAFNSLLLLVVASINRKDALFFSHILLLAAVFVNLLLLVAVASIYLVNFR
jgi:hypothetical protein